MTDHPENPGTEAGRISRMLGLYKAEWLNGNLFELFSEPQYFGELKTSRPCVLIGGRGTGKTTVLKGLSYKGQYALNHNDASSLKAAGFYGIYYRINTNRVTAFKGEELTESRWIRYFAHYMNLVFCTQLLEFVEWYGVQTGAPVEADGKSVAKVGLTFGISEVNSLAALSEAIASLLLRFEASINALTESSIANLSLQGAPIDQLTDALCSTPAFQGKQFHFLIDEFENFENYQQRVLNTLIKHASTNYTFKIGVRELGWRERATLNANEQLTSPADYAHINIANVLTGAKFKNFASDVILSRLAPQLNKEDGRVFLRTILPGLSEAEEAECLLEKAEVDHLRRLVQQHVRNMDIEKAMSVPIGKLAFAKYWNDHNRDEPLSDAFRGVVQGQPVWAQRINNYFYSYLFTIRKGKSGVRKYYCGWDTFVKLANGNIRYLLELVHSAFLLHLDEKQTIGPISPKTQTQAAQAVGKKNLDELQGLSVDGASLTKLLLSLGRIFQLFAEDPAGHAPEANEFHIREDSGGQDASAVSLLNSAVMHLALVRRTANKLTDTRDTKEYDYSVHPIFAPFFVFSYRRKRKIGLSADQLMRLVKSPRTAIEEVIRQNNRDAVTNVNLPDQMGLFEAFYE